MSSTVSYGVTRPVRAKSANKSRYGVLESDSRISSKLIPAYSFFTYKEHDVTYMLVVVLTHFKITVKVISVLGIGCDSRKSGEYALDMVEYMRFPSCLMFINELDELSLSVSEISCASS